MDHVLTIGWRNLAVRLWGPPEGRPVFMLHGTPGTRLDVRLDEQELYHPAIRLITYDRPGYGRSDPYPERSVAQAADDVRFIADALGYERFAVIGRSGGAPHALACAALLPDRVTRVASMVGLAPYGEADLDWMAGMSARNKFQYAAAIAGPAELRRVIYPEVHALRTNPHAFPGRWLAEAPEVDQQQLRRPHFGEAYLASLQHAVERTVDGWAADNLALIRPWGFDPREIRVPTLLWHGLRDVFAPVAHSRWLAERIRTSRLEVSDLGHLHVGGVQSAALNWLVESTTPAPCMR